MDKKKYLFLTGASSGIGRQIAVGLSSEYNLVLCARNGEKLLETKSLCSNQSNHQIFKFDLSEVESMEKSLPDFIKLNDIEITHFVHSAGFMKMIPLKMVSISNINQIFATNVISAVLTVKILTSKKHNNSALQNVVFISSNISNFGSKAFSIYSASKAALDSAMRSLAIELAPKVRINSVLPGAIKTGMTKDVFENQEVITRMLSTYPLGEGKPEDICSAVEFLLSEKSRWITGQQIVVDGGRTINISG
jgi:NAD(P)-dependent dehydrogenase (short-subunit alcohol dehydrogenase family)